MLRKAVERSRIVAVLTLGFGYGALVFGGTISVAHVVYNRLPFVQDALLLWFASSLLFGAPVAATCGFVLLLQAIRGRHRSKGDDGSALGWGLALFHVGFFGSVAIYGFTYDQYPFGEIESAIGMAVFLVVLALLVSALAVALSFPIAGWIARYSAGGFPRGLMSIGVIFLLLHALMPIAFRLASGTNGSETANVLFRPLRDQERTQQKVVFLGLDGADWHVVDALMEKGDLPHFRQLVETGSRARLETLPDANSALLWASIYTGKRPRKHGCLDFYRIRLAGMRGRGVFPVHRTSFKEAIGLFLEPLGLAQRRIINRSCLNARPIWEVLNDLSASIGVVDGYSYSIPARSLHREQSYFFSYALNGAGRRSDGGIRALDDRALSALVRPPRAVRHFEPYQEQEDFYWQSNTLLSILDGEPQPDFLQLYTHQPDSFQHWYWKWYEPELFFGVDAGDLHQYGDRIAAIYRDFDRFLGKLLSRLDANTTLIIASDHGHSPTLVHQLYTQHRHGPPGVLLMAGPSVRAGHELSSAHILDLAPTILYLLGFPVARDLDGQVLLEALEPEFVEAAPVRQIESYEGFADSFEDVDLSNELNAEELEKLRALGYI